ncbi:MAG: hypothetical protein U5K74_03790 [Gemmatimonadaceae bacterium]|nr:hypothetical protein [Gemmatimonadaceae bacterium]
MAVFAAAIIGLGLYPAPVLHRMEASVAALVNRVNMSAMMTPTASAGPEVRP